MSREIAAIVVGFSADPKYFDDDELEVSVVVKLADVGNLQLSDKITIVAPERS